MAAVMRTVDGATGGDKRISDFARRFFRGGGFGCDGLMNLTSEVEVMSVADALSGSGSSSKDEPGDEQETGGEKFSVSRQLSMRKSRILSEHEKDNNLSGPLGVPRLPVTTSLSPLTPLKWKSIRQDDVEKEPQKGRDVVTKSDASQPEEAIEEQPPTVLTGRDDSVDKQVKCSGGTLPANEEHTSEQSSGGDASGLERKVSAGDETSVTTIDFLRARLLAERAASKAAKEHVQQITKKVIELERKLEQETLLRKNAEAAEQETLLKLKMKRKEVLMSGSSTEVLDTAQTFNVGNETEWGAEDQKDLVEPSVVEKEGTDASGASDQIHGDVYEMTEKAMNNSKSVQDISTSDESDVMSTDKTGLKISQPEMNWQEKRSGREERLHNMWHRITEELAVLAECQSQEELPNWMQQLIAILQDIIPETFRNTGLNLQNGGSGNSEASMDGPISEVDSEQDQSMAKNQDGESSEGTGDRLLLLSSAEVLQQKDAGPYKVDANDNRMQTKVHKEHGLVMGEALQLKIDSEPKNVTELIERYEAQENLQREWEQNYYAQQMLDRLKVGNCKSRKEGHSSHTSSEAGTSPSGPQLNSQQGALTETTVDAPDAAPLHDLLMSHKADRQNVDLYTYADALYVQSDSPSMISVSGNIRLEAKDGEEDSWLVPQESGLEKLIDPTHLPSGTRFAGSKGRGRQPEKELNDLKYQQATSHDRRFHEDIVSYNGRELTDMEEVHSPQGSSLVQLSEDAPQSSVSDFRGMSSMGDTSGEELSQGQLQVQDDRGEPVGSSASSNGGHHRVDHSPGYLLRDSERGREKNHRQREGISRSSIREGAHGSKPTPQADNTGWKGDKDLPYGEKQDFSEMGFQHQQDSENSRQAEDNGGMPDNTVHAKVDPPLSFCCPSQDTAKTYTHKPQASLGQASSKVNDVLRALQIAKLNIQGSGVKKGIVTSSYVTTNEYSNTGGSLVSRTGYGVADAAGQYIGPTTDVGLQPRFIKPHITVSGSPIVSMPSSANSSLYNSPGAEVVSRDTRDVGNRRADGMTLINNHGHSSSSSLVDKMTVGQGIQFFFPPRS